MALAIHDLGHARSPRADGQSTESEGLQASDQSGAQVCGKRYPERASWLTALGLERKTAPDANIASSWPAKLAREEERWLAAVDHLVRSKFASSGGSDGRLAEALDRLRRYVKGANSKCLQAVARLGVQACEATINMGWVFHDAREVAQSTESISSAVEEMAASITELSHSSDASASQAEMARDTMRSCISDSRGATEAMVAIQGRASNIEQRLGVLQSAVDQISGMAGHVEAIAQQTNLLALNATIEAARAGEHGRGFAVVASEVKALSVETSKATKEIHARVKTLKEEMGGISTAVTESLKSVFAGNSVVKQVSTIIEGVGDEVSEIADRIRGLSDLLQQQRAATSEIARNSARISEKALKTRDEVAAIGRRLQNCEAVVEQTFDAASDWPVSHLELTRFAADASAWKRRLSSILLAAEPAPQQTPQLRAAAVLADADRCLSEHSGDKELLAKLARAVADAQEKADVVVCEVRKANWGGATPAYIACEEALGKAIAAASELSEPSSKEAQR